MILTSCAMSPFREAFRSPEHRYCDSSLSVLLFLAGPLLGSCTGSLTTGQSEVSSCSPWPSQVSEWELPFEYGCS